jgi:hypothetical protein
MPVQLEIGHAFHLGLLDQLLLVLLEFLLIFNQHILHSRLNDIAERDIRVILRTSHIRLICVRSHLIVTMA